MSGYIGKKTSFKDAWREYARRRNLLLFIFIGYIPWGGIVFLASGLGLPTTVAWILIGAWFAAFPIAATWLMFWTCPRCGNSFFLKWWYHNGFARKCVHCGLHKNEIAAVARSMSQ